MSNAPRPGCRDTSELRRFHHVPACQPHSPDREPHRLPVDLQLIPGPRAGCMSSLSNSPWPRKRRDCGSRPLCGVPVGLLRRCLPSQPLRKDRLPPIGGAWRRRRPCRRTRCEWTATVSGTVVGRCDQRDRPIRSVAVTVALGGRVTGHQKHRNWAWRRLEPPRSFNSPAVSATLHANMRRSRPLGDAAPDLKVPKAAAWNTS